MDCTIRIAKTKVLISCAVTVRLICIFVFAYAKSWFSHNEAQFVYHIQKSFIFLSLNAKQHLPHLSYCTTKQLWFLVHTGSDQQATIRSSIDCNPETGNHSESSNMRSQIIVLLLVHTGSHQQATIRSSIDCNPETGNHLESSNITSQKIVLVSGSRPPLEPQLIMTEMGNQTVSDNMT